MSRPKGFNRTEVLERAMELFWRQGFQCTSIQELVDHMGIGRASLYDTFGSKDGLLSESLDCYIERVGAYVLQSLRRPGPARAILTSYFDELVLQAGRGDPRCCLMTRTALLRDPPDGRLHGRIAALLDQVETALVELLERGRASGEFRTDVGCRALARHLLNTMQGMAVSASVREDAGILKDIAQVTLSMLDVPYKRT